MAGNSTTGTVNGPLKRLYDYCMEWIAGPYGVWTLFIIAFVESSFFPIPPDVMLAPMVLAQRQRAWWLATLTSVGSVVGSLIGLEASHGESAMK